MLIRKFYDRLGDEPNMAGYRYGGDGDWVEHPFPKSNYKVKTEKQIETESKEKYVKLLDSGMFWEIYPELTGNWEKDKDEFMDIE